ncbi:MAG: winged helix-turn-helix transcriptional regulator [Lachnospiraceae bacterium]|nr:winged helix-turn-helix transcriptional regulator [Lachnospiraceae bacterium]
MGKVMILSFTDDEEDIYKRILQIINGSKNFEQCSAFQNIKLIQAGKLWIDCMQRSVCVNNIEIELTYIEFEILYLLAGNPGRVFRKEQIYDIVWNEAYAGDYNIVMSHIHNIREKIEDNPSKPIYIQTVWGVGYRFNKNLNSGL